MAYENMTYEYLFERMKDRVTDKYPNLDSRESSMIYNALSSEAMELAIAYTELDNVRNETFIQTASRDGKIKRCEEQNIDVSIFNSTYGTFEGKFDGEVSIGSRWNLDLYNYTVTEFRYSAVESETTYYYYAMECETAGSAANNVRGMLVPITDAPAGVTYSELTNVLIPGRDEFTDEEIEDYYISHVNGTATDGNVAQYQQWCDEYPDIGNHKIFPCWNGINTVEVSILDNENGIASDLLVEEFQEYLDPPTSMIDDVNKESTGYDTINSLYDAPSTKLNIVKGENQWYTFKLIVEGDYIYVYAKAPSEEDFTYYGYKPKIKSGDRTILFMQDTVKPLISSFVLYERNNSTTSAQNPPDIDGRYTEVLVDQFENLNNWDNNEQPFSGWTLGSGIVPYMTPQLDQTGCQARLKRTLHDFAVVFNVAFTTASGSDPAAAGQSFIMSIVDPNNLNYSPWSMGSLYINTVEGQQGFKGTVPHDYPQGRGMGNGRAPIGAIVTVTTATEESIKLAGTIKLASGYTSTASIDTAVDEYFNSIAYETSVVNYFSLAAIISNCECVEELNNLTVNGAQQNVTLGDRKIPVRTSSDWSVTK